MPTLTISLTYLRMALVLNIFFITVYGLTNILAHRRSEHLQLYFQWELDIPLVPAMTPVYGSIMLLFVLPLFCLGPSQLRSLARNMVSAILVAGVAFLLFPAKIGYSPPDSDSGFSFGLMIIRSLDLPYNLCPSLHIALSTLTIAAIYAYVSRPLRLLLLTWLMAICFAVLLVHQHHVIDIVGGLTLGWLLQRNKTSPI